MPIDDRAEKTEADPNIFMRSASAIALSCRLLKIAFDDTPFGVAHEHDDFVTLFGGSSSASMRSIASLLFMSDR